MNSFLWRDNQNSVIFILNPICGLNELGSSFFFIEKTNAFLLLSLTFTSNEWIIFTSFEANSLIQWSKLDGFHSFIKISNIFAHFTIFHSLFYPWIRSSFFMISASSRNKSSLRSTVFLRFSRIKLNLYLPFGQFQNPISHSPIFIPSFYSFPLFLLLYYCRHNCPPPLPSIPSFLPVPFHPLHSVPFRYLSFEEGNGRMAAPGRGRSWAIVREGSAGLKMGNVVGKKM